MPNLKNKADKNNSNNGFNEQEHSMKYFELHANQRISLIKLYIFLLSIYISASGYLITRFPKTSISEEICLLAFSLVFIGLTFIFWFMDYRNRYLIHIAENSLCAMEKKLKNKNSRIFIKEKESAEASIRHTHCFIMLFSLSILCAVLICFYSIMSAFDINHVSNSCCPKNFTICNCITSN